MKKFSTVVIILVVGLLVYYGVRSSKMTSAGRSADSGPASHQVPVARTTDTTHPPTAASFQAKNPAEVPGPIAMRAASPGAPVTNAEALALSPRIVLENVRSAIRLYGSTYGGNPVGTNPEITAALTGDNPKHIHFIGADSGLSVDDKGELVDPWGTPLFFHQLSGAETEIRSAGPDKRMWTTDDLVTK